MCVQFEGWTITSSAPHQFGPTPVLRIRISAEFIGIAWSRWGRRPAIKQSLLASERPESKRFLTGHVAGFTGEGIPGRKEDLHGGGAKTCMGKGRTPGRSPAGLRLKQLWDRNVAEREAKKKAQQAVTGAQPAAPKATSARCTPSCASLSALTAPCSAPAPPRARTTSHFQQPCCPATALTFFQNVVFPLPARPA